MRPKQQGTLRARIPNVGTGLGSLVGGSREPYAGLREADVRKSQQCVQIGVTPGPIVKVSPERVDRGQG